MRFLGNLLWLLIVGVWTSLTWLILGLVWCVTIIGIPFGLQCFKFSRLTLLPFGTKAMTCFSSHPLANLIWLIFGGLVLALGYLVVGLVWCVTIIGIPFGLQCFKMARLALSPFGAVVR